VFENILKDLEHFMKSTSCLIEEAILVITFCSTIYLGLLVLMYWLVCEMKVIVILVYYTSA